MGEARNCKFETKMIMESTKIWMKYHPRGVFSKVARPSVKFYGPHPIFGMDEATHFKIGKWSNDANISIGVFSKVTFTSHSTLC